MCAGLSFYCTCASLQPYGERRGIKHNHGDRISSIQTSAYLRVNYLHSSTYVKPPDQILPTLSDDVYKKMTEEADKETFSFIELWLGLGLGLQQIRLSYDRLA